MKDLKDIFGRYFLIAGYLPAVVFFTLVRLLIVPYLPTDWQTSLEEMMIAGFSADLTLSILVPLVFAVLLVSVSPQIIRLFTLEYKPFGVPQKIKDEHNLWTAELRKIAEQLVATDDLERRRGLVADVEGVQRKLWPLTSGAVVLDTGNLKSTRLGNVFAAMNEYPERRYGMRVGPMWPRLLTVLPKEFESRIRSQNTSFMFLLNMAACSLLFTMLWVLLGIASLLEWVSVPIWVWVIVLVGGATVVYPFYRSAISEAKVLAEDVMTAFDLYRGGLLKQYGIKPPTTMQEEAALWRELSFFIALGDGRLYPAYAKTDDQKEAPKSGE